MPILKNLPLISIAFFWCFLGWGGSDLAVADENTLVIERFPAQVGNSWEYRRTFNIVVYDTVNNDTTETFLIDNLYTTFQAIDTVRDWDCYRYNLVLIEKGDTLTETRWYTHPDTAFIWIAYAGQVLTGGPPGKRMEKIRFKSDDHSGFFQVFRTDIWPRSYSDFTGKLIAAVETDVSKLSFQKASNAAYIDYINPNKWYYYCFRTIDFHGHISNPSELFRIKLVDEKGTVFPIIEECDFNRQIEKINYKPMRKYLFIKPKLSQTVVNEQKSGIENLESVKDVRDIQLGLMDETVFGKDYLIRLTSKQSGKTIEFKIRLNHNFVKKDI